jgi:hypothetical protein
MNAIEIADLLEQVPMSRRVGVPEVAAMLRKQDAAIKQLREACQDIVQEFGECYVSYKCQQALAATEEFE